ncbi:phosphatase domain-containing protein [Leucobacter soli]|uniref:phosphatase domain-containing protein n=1 Tax=Leucobacter soli TaxID=2812850 RepID=UPI00362086B4
MAHGHPADRRHRRRGCAGDRGGSARPLRHHQRRRRHHSEHRAPRPLVAAWNSFVVDEHARTSTPGMPVLYDHLVAEHPGAPVIYVSTGAWNVAPALSRFLERNLYPMGPLLLTDWGPTTERWFRSGKEHKLRELSRLAQEFPEVKWLLVGDDGQHDEQLYHEFAIRHPGNVAAVAIRQLSVGQAVLAGGRSKARLHQGVSGVPWVYGPDGATLREELRSIGLL